VVSQTRQAIYDYQTALHTLDNAYKTVTSDTRQFFNNVISGISRIRASRQAILSSQKSLESNEASFRVGTRTILDVLEKQRDLYDTQRVAANDQYRYIIDILRLKQAAGTLSIADLEQINTWLITPTAHTTIERFAYRQKPRTPNYWLHQSLKSKAMRKAKSKHKIHAKAKRKHKTLAEVKHHHHKKTHHRRKKKI